MAKAAPCGHRRSVGKRPETVFPLVHISKRGKKRKRGKGKLGAVLEKWEQAKVPGKKRKPENALTIVACGGSSSKRGKRKKKSLRQSPPPPPPTSVKPT